MPFISLWKSKFLDSGTPNAKKSNKKHFSLFFFGGDVRLILYKSQETFIFKNFYLSRLVDTFQMQS